jgi:hypothetical protein
LGGGDGCSGLGVSVEGGWEGSGGGKTGGETCVEGWVFFEWAGEGELYLSGEFGAWRVVEGEWV